jgi:cell fate (sporulation/competence/biofilm development) regulator YmcA (YheA/YmcA/DUF963 family)
MTTAQNSTMLQTVRQKQLEQSPIASPRHHLHNDYREELNQSTNNITKGSCAQNFKRNCIQIYDLSNVSKYIVTLKKKQKSRIKLSHIHQKIGAIT